MRLIWAFGVESRQASVVLPCLQSCFEDLHALTGGSRPPILRLHSDKASEFLSAAIRAFLYRHMPLSMPPLAPPRGLSPPPFPSGEGGSLSFSPSFSSPSFSSLLRGPQFSTVGASENSTFGTQTFMSMRKFLDDAEKRVHQGTKEETSKGDTECKEEYPAVTDEPAKSSASSAEQRLPGEATGEAQKDMCRENLQTEVEKEVLRAFRALFDEFEGQFYSHEQQETSSSESESDELQSESVVQAANIQSLPDAEHMDDWIPRREPQLYLCDDWIQPVEVVRKPRNMSTKETMRANAAKNCLILALMSLELGYGSIIERYQQARDAVVERYQEVLTPNFFWNQSFSLMKRCPLEQLISLNAWPNLQLYSSHATANTTDRQCVKKRGNSDECCCS